MITRRSLPNLSMALALSRNRLHRRQRIMTSEELRRPCQLTSPIGRRSSGTSTQVVTRREVAWRMRERMTMRVGGYHRMSFWRGREWLLCQCRRVLEGLLREEILVGSEMQFGQKLASNDFTVFCLFCFVLLFITCVFLCFDFGKCNFSWDISVLILHVYEILVINSKPGVCIIMSTRISSTLLRVFVMEESDWIIPMTRQYSHKTV